MKRLLNFIALAFGVVGVYSLAIQKAQAGPYITYEFVSLDLAKLNPG